MCTRNVVFPSHPRSLFFVLGFLSEHSNRYIYLEINGIKANFFVRIGNMSICEHYAFVHDKLLLFAEQQEMGMPAHSKKFEAFNNMHLIACRDRITEEIRLEICQKFQKAILQ